MKPLPTGSEGQVALELESQGPIERKRAGKELENVLSQPDVAPPSLAPVLQLGRLLLERPDVLRQGPPLLFEPVPLLPGLRVSSTGHVSVAAGRGDERREDQAG